MIQQATYAVPRVDLGGPFWQYMNDPLAGHIGNLVLPRIRVPEVAGNFSVVSRDAMLRVEDTRRADGAAFPRVDSKTYDDSYATIGYGLETKLTRKQRSRYASDFDAELVSIRTLAKKVNLAYEKRVAAAVFNATTWTGTAYYTDYSSAPWATITTDIIGQVAAAKEKVRRNTGHRANTLIIGEANLVNMKKNTGIKNMFPGAPMITDEHIFNALAGLLGLKQILVGGAVENTAPEDQGFTGSDIWSDTYAMVAKLAMPDDQIEEPCIGRTMEWDGMEVPGSVEAYYEPQTKSDIFQIEHNTHEKIIDKAYGHLMDVKA